VKNTIQTNLNILAMKKKSVFKPLFWVTLSMVFLFAGCAQRIPLDPSLQTDTFGFLGGLWHGVIAPLSFVVSIFDNDVAMYAVNNNGAWYDFGFVLGAGILFGSGGKASK
jgi:hypothetical protein